MCAIVEIVTFRYVTQWRFFCSIPFYFSFNILQCMYLFEGVPTLHHIETSSSYSLDCRWKRMVKSWSFFTKTLGKEILFLSIQICESNIYLGRFICFYQFAKSKPIWWNFRPDSSNKFESLQTVGIIYCTLFCIIGRHRLRHKSKRRWWRKGQRAPEFTHWFVPTCIVCPVAPSPEGFSHCGGRIQNNSDNCLRFISFTN